MASIAALSASFETNLKAIEDEQKDSAKAILLNQVADLREKVQYRP